ncbi:MAG TPA: methyltransferase domain-containing protein [Propionibacteriaceae bacterium]|nr:methyltransferase domain-containing protein [Propionibacteriaceae bacterium]
MAESEWTWDPTLYAGSARFYADGRVAYPVSLATALTDELGLDGTGRLLDVGCGPGSLTLLLADRFAAAVGIDADPDMIEEARERARRAGVGNIDWATMRGEELPGALGTFEVVSFAQSFHWMQRELVARAVRSMLVPEGACVHVHATTHQGVDDDADLPHPRPPRAEINDLVRRYLGPVRRAGRGVFNDAGGGEDAIYRTAGFADRRRIEVGGGPVERSTDEVVASIFSLSSSTPHLFGDRVLEFEHELRGLLQVASPGGVFSEQMPAVAVDVWRP